MYRKNNPWVALVAVMLLALILAFICTGCAVSTAEAAGFTVTKNSDRFTFERHFYGEWPDCYIITDNETGIQYLFVDTAYGSGLAKLEG